MPPALPSPMNNENIGEQSNADANPLFDIIQNLQSKLSNQTSTNTTTPEPITSTNDSSEFNLNNIMDLLNNVGMNKKTHEDEVNNNNIASSIPNLNIDLNTIMKFQKIFSAANQNDPRKNLLTSLKPFLRETRQKNIDTYITLLSLINALDIFTNKGSD